MRFLIGGASTYGVKNAGDDAMFWTLVHGLREKHPNAEITFLARHPDARFDRVFGVRSIKNIDHDTKEQSAGRFFWGFNRGDPTAHLREIWRQLADTDLLIIGGNSFMEISPNSWMRGVATYSATFATWARLLEKEYALYGVAAHPLELEGTRVVARYLCDNARVATLREEYTRRVLLDAGVRGDNLRVLADPAWGLDPVKGTDMGLSLLKEEGIPVGERPLAAIAFRHHYWKWTEEEFRANAAKVAAMADAIVEETGADVLFIPNCTYAQGHKYQDDRAVAPIVRSMMKHRDRAHEIRGDYTLPETLSFFPLLSLLISNRRHSCVFAALHNVPFLALNEGRLWHFQPWLEELGLAGQGINFTEDALDALHGRVRDSHARRDEIKRALAKAIPDLRTRARSHVGVILDS